METGSRAQICLLTGHFPHHSAVCDRADLSGAYDYSKPLFYWCFKEFGCFTVDPNKDRREAVKRKTTQYLKRAEEIFITHLQDNLGKGGSHLGVRKRSWFLPLK